MMEYMVMVILKQPTDGPLSKALARGGIHTITDLLTLSQLARDALTYHDVYGNVKPLAIGHKNLLRMLKVYGAYCEAKGSPVKDWMMITKKDFDDFRCSRAGLRASEWYDTVAPATTPVILPKSSSSTVSVTTSASLPVAASVVTSASSSSAVSAMASKSSSTAVQFAMSKRSPTTVSVVTTRSSSSTVSVSVFKSATDSVEDRDTLVSFDGKAALHHVLSEVLSTPWLLAEALERSGFYEIQDVLLMNQAERDMLTFLNGNGVVTPLPQAEKNKLLNIKLFSAYRKRIGRPIVDWTKVTKADFKSVALYMEEEQVTIPRRTMGSHTNATQPWHVPSTLTVTERRSFAVRPRNATSTAMLTPAPTVIKPWSVACTTTVLPTPMIDFTSISPDVKVIDTLDVMITDDPDIKANDSTLVEQLLSEPPTYDPPPVKQQDVLYDFYRYIDQGTFGIPCRGKIYCPLPGMRPVAWPQEKSARLPRTLAQLACQDFKKEPPDNFAIVLSPQYPIVPHSL